MRRLSAMLTAIPNPQIRFDCLFQFRGLGELSIQLRDEPRHLFLERLAVVFDFLGADVAAGREDVAVRGDFLEGRRFAEAGNVGVIGRAAFPLAEGAGDLFQVLRGEVAQDAVDHVAELAGVDEEGLAGAVAVFAAALPSCSS